MLIQLGRITWSDFTNLMSSFYMAPMTFLMSSNKWKGLFLEEDSPLYRVLCKHGLISEYVQTHTWSLLLPYLLHSRSGNINFRKHGLSLHLECGLYSNKNRRYHPHSLSLLLQGSVIKQSVGFLASPASLKAHRLKSSVHVYIHFKKPCWQIKAGIPYGLKADLHLYTVNLNC